MAIEKPADKLLQGSSKHRNVWLWLEGLRCFRRNFRAWLKWALVVWLLEIALLLPIFWHSTIVDKEWLDYVAALTPIAVFLAFYLQQEPIFGVAKFSRKNLFPILKSVLRIFLSEMPIWVGAIVAMCSPQISEYFGWPRHFSKDDINTGFVILVMSGLILFKGSFCYFLFRIFQLLALVSTNVAKPLEMGRLLNQGNLWWVFRNFCVLYFADFLIDSIGQVSSIYLFVNLAQWLMEMGIGSAMEVAGVFLAVVTVLYYTVVLGVFVAYAAAANRVLYQKKLRDDPAFRLVLNGDAVS